jgi:hypothetical protein
LSRPVFPVRTSGSQSPFIHPEFSGRLIGIGSLSPLCQRFCRLDGEIMNQIVMRFSSSLRIATISTLGLMVAVMACGNSPIAHADGSRIHYSVDIRVHLNGLRVASGNFQTTIAADGYHLAGAVESRGIVELFEQVRGRTEAKGALGDAGLIPRDYVIQYASGDENKRTTIQYSGGKITETNNEPPLRKRGDWIPLGHDDLEQAADPFSAMILPASDLGDVCNQTIRSFDGAMRADLKLSLAGFTDFRTKGFSSPAVVCNARFVPRSGYHGGRDTIAFMRDRSRITITFVPLVEGALYGPVGAQIGTKVGTIVVSARKIGVTRR